MNCDELQQLAALEALGALEGPEAARWRERVQTDPAARAELARFLQVTDALACSVPRQRPSGHVRSRILERVARQAQSAVTHREPPAPPPPPAIQFILNDAPWMPAPAPGARFKLLSAGPHQDYLMMLIELAPGGGYPEHDHVGVEEMYVLTGDLQTEGRSLGPGDFLHAEPGSHHQELRSINGCTAIMVVPKAALEALMPR
jgi:quercetin dioxygenase-like cupin family protein